MVESASRIAASFSLGSVKGPLTLAADGWGGHNKVFRMDTSAGSWAIKRHGRRPTEISVSAFPIEMAAMKGGVPVPRPVVTTDGGCWANVDGALFRCHAWIDGSAKENEASTAAEAAAMGRIVGHLHALRIPCPAVQAPVPPGREAWRELVRAGAARHAVWATKIDRAFEQLVAIGGQPRPLDLGCGELVGSHRDLNAHNVLFSSTGLRLVDWDSAGPAWPRWERADFALRWGARHDGSYDEEAVVAFLRGYLDGGGELEADDPSVLAAGAAALTPWVLQNVELAIDGRSEAQDCLAAVLVDALLDMPRKVGTRQAVLARCLSRV